MVQPSSHSTMQTPYQQVHQPPLSTSSPTDRGTTCHSDDSPLPGTAHWIWAISFPIGSWRTKRGWKCRRSYQQLDISMPLIFWAEAVRLRHPVLCSKNKHSDFIYACFFIYIRNTHLLWSDASLVNPQDGVFFRLTVWLSPFLTSNFLSKRYPLSFSLARHPQKGFSFTTCNKNMAHLSTNTGQSPRAFWLRSKPQNYHYFSPPSRKIETPTWRQVTDSVKIKDLSTENLHFCCRSKRALYPPIEI